MHSGDLTDDLIAGGQQLLGLLGQVMGDSLLGSRIRLIDVYAIHWAAKADGCVCALVLRSTSNGMVEDENLRCSSTWESVNRWSGW
jgi:hypothetical protein